jgi:hypothetical protein
MAQSEDKCDDNHQYARALKSVVTLEPHICRVCFGRIAKEPLVTAGGSGQFNLYVCTNCGAKATGRDASVLCCCGITVRKTGDSGKPTSDYMDAGIRCHENENQSPEFPAQIVASYRGQST